MLDISVAGERSLPLSLFLTGLSSAEILPPDDLVISLVSSSRHDCYPGAAGGFALLSRGIQSASGGDEGKSAAIEAQNLDLDLGAIGNLSEVVTSSIRDVELALIADSAYWTPLQACFKYFHLLHSTFDLPWVGAVAAGTIFARLLLLPVNIEQMRMAERMAVAKPDIDRLTAEAKEAAAKGGQDATHYSMEMQKLWKKHGVHPGRALGANLIVLPIMLLLPISILNLPKLGLPSLEAESFFWIQSVAVADPIYALPVASSALFFGAVHYNMSPESMTPQMQKILPIFKILPIAFLPVTVTLPALFHIFGITSVVFQTGQTTMLKNKSVREWLGFKPQISQVLQQIQEAQIIKGPTPREVPAQQQPKQKQQKRKGRKNKRRKK